MANKTIVRHEKLETAFPVPPSDGTVVLVNFSKEAVSADGAELAAESFRVTKGGRFEKKQKNGAAVRLPKYTVAQKRNERWGWLFILPWFIGAAPSSCA